MRGGFVVACCLASILPEATEKPLNRVAPGRNHGADAAGSQPGHERVGIVAAVSYDIDWGQAFKQGKASGAS